LQSLKILFPVNCIIIEDQPPAQRILKRFIKDVPDLNLMAVFASALEALDYINENEIDLIFLDIHLPKLSGIDFIKSLSSTPEIILTTAFSEYALDGYDLNVADYLLKPFSFQRFCQAISKVKSRVKTGGTIDLEEDIFIKSGYDYLKIKVKDILYIKSDSDYTELMTSKAKYVSTESLKYWLSKFESLPFTQVHKSYIVHITHISKVSGNIIFFENGAQIPVGRAYKDDFLTNYLG
jgi:DNA-binding LytR/AlgR family response regulator